MSITFYHASPSRNTTSILQKGLLVRSSHKGLGLSDIEVLTGRGIYLTPYLEDALTLACQSLTGRQHWTIFEVHLPVGTHTYSDVKAKGCVTVMDNIPPQHLKVVGYYDTKSERLSPVAPKTYYKGPTSHTREATRKYRQNLKELTKAYREYQQERERERKESELYNLDSR